MNFLEYLWVMRFDSIESILMALGTAWSFRSIVGWDNGLFNFLVTFITILSTSLFMKYRKYKIIKNTLDKYK